MAEDARAFCHHCQWRKVEAKRHGGLCLKCFKDLEIRALYQEIPLTKFVQKLPPLPAEPTFAIPGSQEKMRIMMERVARGERVFHPDDREEWKTGHG